MMWGVHLPLLVLKMEEEGSLWKLGKARKHPPLEPPERNSPANVLILAQGELGQTANLQNCKIMDLCCFKPLCYGNLLQQQPKLSSCLHTMACRSLLAAASLAASNLCCWVLLSAHVFPTFLGSQK